MLKKRLLPCFLCVLVYYLPSIKCHAQSYEPNWESLNSRPVPGWWLDAKFGIFIHWGVYSVPSYAPLGSYSEWYWKHLEEGKKSTRAFHDRVYGENFPYQSFAPMFKAKLFDPEQWADFFLRSGAKYVVLTSKHHDGYTLWQSEEANKSWGRPWNSVDMGPNRDLLGELTRAVRDKGLKMGIYYSLYEWFNPLYLADKSLYVDHHMIPQFKDVVTKYKPSVIFSDGEWDMPAENWKSPEFLAWLFNESPVKDDVVVNDRWGKESRHKNGGYYTTEYASGLSGGGHAWEESRGMGHSYAYNRIETVNDYRSGQELILMLIDIVSRGGNFLLDIGPTADGRIPVIMQERLLQMGNWLKVNGEAIYGTDTWSRPSQWSGDNIQEVKRGQYKTGWDVLRQTLHPKEGEAFIEFFFTRKGNVLYAIAPALSSGEAIIKDIKTSGNTTISVLGVAEPLKWEAVNGNVVVDIPPKPFDQLPYTIKMTHVK